MINDSRVNHLPLDDPALPLPIKSILNLDTINLVSNIYQNYQLFEEFRDSLGNTVLHYAYSSNNFDAIILLFVIILLPILQALITCFKIKIMKMVKISLIYLLNPACLMSKNHH